MIFVDRSTTPRPESSAPGVQSAQSTLRSHNVFFRATERAAPINLHKFGDKTTNCDISSEDFLSQHSCTSVSSECTLGALLQCVPASGASPYILPHADSWLIDLVASSDLLGLPRYEAGNRGFATFHWPTHHDLEGPVAAVHVSFLCRREQTTA